jgi:hypothetical protein
MKINLNRECLIRELPRGVEAFDKHFRSLGLIPLEFRSAAKQPDGRLKLPLHAVMHYYGDAMFMGPQPPIEIEIELV